MAHGRFKGFYPKSMGKGEGGSKRRRETPVEWEAGDVKRGRVAGVAQGRGKDNVGGKLAGMMYEG